MTNGNSSYNGNSNLNSPVTGNPNCSIINPCTWCMQGMMCTVRS
jgi:hypothetical protein